MLSRRLLGAAAGVALVVGGRWGFRHAPRRRAARIARRTRAITSDAAAVQALLAHDNAVSRPQRPAVIVNPAKLGALAMRRLIEAIAAGAGAQVTWWETTPASPGEQQARAAVVGGADLVVAVGGDGTVRSVAAGVAGTGVPLGVVPLGTGNLFARNVGANLDDIAGAVRDALCGVDRVVDMGHIRVKGPDSPPSEHTFLVVAGIGFDASMVADTPAQLKAIMGWSAYLIGAARNLARPRPLVRYRLDAGPLHVSHKHSVLAANCGQLPAGIDLVPGARLDDGLLDVLATEIRAGLMGWADAACRVLVRSIRRRRDWEGAARFHLAAARTLTVRSASFLPVQVDGEWVTVTRELHAWVQPAALLVRTAPTDQRTAKPAARSR